MTLTRCAFPDRTTRMFSAWSTENTLKVRDELPQLKVRMFKKNHNLSAQSQQGPTPRSCALTRAWSFSTVCWMSSLLRSTYTFDSS